MMEALRSAPPTTLAGRAVTVVDHLTKRGQLRTDAVELIGDGIRVVVRPSGTEPKVKAYLEAVLPVGDRSNLPDARARAESVLGELRAFALQL